jgi:hypothetical protein
MGTGLFYGMGAVIFFAAFAMNFNQGIWSNLLTLINLLLSGILSFGLFGAVNELLVEYSGNEYRYVLPIVSIWLVFIVSFVVLQRLITGLASRTHLKFISQLDSGVGALLAAVVGMVLVGYSMATLHVAPLPVEMFAGRFDYQASDGAYGHPDLAFLKITEIALKNQNWGAIGETSGSFDAEEYISAFRNMRADLETKQGLLSR